MAFLGILAAYIATAAGVVAPQVATIAAVGTAVGTAATVGAGVYGATQGGKGGGPGAGAMNALQLQQEEEKKRAAKIAEATKLANEKRMKFGGAGLPILGALGGAPASGFGKSLLGG